MPDDTTTVDRMQVVFSTNLEELIASLAVAETRLDAINDAFTRSEAASETYAETMETAGSAAAASSDGFTALSGSIDNLSGVSATGSAAVSSYADSLMGTQAAVTTANYQMEQAVGRFGEMNTAATNTATAIGRINNVSNNTYTTFSRLSTTSGVTAKSLSKLSTETKTLSSAYTAAATNTDTFTKSVSQTGTAAATVTTQINEYSKAISTAGDEAQEASEEMDNVTKKTGETEGAMSKLGDVVGKAFAGLSVGTLLSTLDTIIDRAEKVSQTFQNLESDVTTSLGDISPEVTDEINSMVADLLGSVPATQNDSLGKGAALLKKYQPDLTTDEYQSLMQEYASYADLWNMNLSDLISSTQKMFTKYNITTSSAMKEALAKINAVNNIAPDAAPSNVISIVNNNRMAIGAQGWSFEDALSRIVNAGNDRAMSKFQEYLSALQNVKATKGALFSSDEEFAAWIQTITEEVKNAKDETEAAKIIKTEYGIWGTSALEIAKYLRLEGTDTDRTAEILAQLEKNGSGYQMYLKQETSSETIARANSQTAAADKTVGDGVLDLKSEVALQNAYTKDLYDVVSIRLGDLTTYIDKIPVVGEVLSPLTGVLKDYVPEINIKKGMKGTAEEFIDQYEFRQESGDYVPTIDETYYLAYRKLADQLQVYYDDLQFSGEDAASIRKDLAEGLYTDLMLRVKAARNGEEVQTIAGVTSDVSGTAGISIAQATFTGTLQLPDGTVLEGTEAAEYLSGAKSMQQEPAEESLSIFDRIGDFFTNLWPFGTADATELIPDTATVQGDFAAVAQGNADVSAAGDMMIAADRATIVADLEPLADMIKPQITVEVTVPAAAEPGTTSYQIPAVTASEMPAPVLALQASAAAEPSGAQASVGFAAESMAEALAAIQQPVIQVPVIEPEIPAVSHSVSVSPQIAVTPAVSADAYLTVPEISVNPALSVLPQVAVNPSVTVYPEITAAVEPAVYPEITIEPEITCTPELSVEPQITVEPSVAVYPEISCAVNPAVYPQITVDPEIQMFPEISVTPELSLQPQITVEPAIDIPAINVYPQINVQPEISVESADTVPEIQLEPQITVEPQITLQVPDIQTAEAETTLPAPIPSITSEWEIPTVNFSVPEIQMPQLDSEVPVASVEDSGSDTILQALSDSLQDLLTLVRMIAGKDTSNTITNRNDIVQNFYAPTVDSYTVKNAASLAVSAAQAKACRM